MLFLFCQQAVQSLSRLPPHLTPIELNNLLPFLFAVIKGNPRGSESSEADPGFRYPVLKLVQVQQDRTVDLRYTVPLGTAIKVRSPLGIFAENRPCDDSCSRHPLLASSSDSTRPRANMTTRP